MFVFSKSYCLIAIFTWTRTLASYRIFDITGRELASKLNISNQENINTAAMATGTYFMEIVKGTNRTTKKFVVTN